MPEGAIHVERAEVASAAEHIDGAMDEWQAVAVLRGCSVDTLQIDAKAVLDRAVAAFLLDEQDRRAPRAVRLAYDVGREHLVHLDVERIERNLRYRILLLRDRRMVASRNVVHD